MRQRILRASWDAIKELKINDSSATSQFTITKVTNPGNECYLFVLPAYRKDEVEQIYRKMENIRRSIRQYFQAPYYSKQKEKALAEFTTCHNEVENWLNKETRDMMTSIGEWKNRIEDLSSNSCSLSNIRRPLLLLVWEKFDVSNNVKSYQGWYKEIKPNDSGTWILR